MSDPAASARARDTLNQSWSKDTSRFGYRMLAKQGWAEGKGLGKAEDGTTEHVRVSKRAAALGLGAAAAEPSSAVALSSAVGEYDALLRALSASTAAVGGAKKRKREADAPAADAGGAGVGGDAAPVRFIGRFAHRNVLRQKNVAGYSPADLRAILGGGVGGGGGGAGGDDGLGDDVGGGAGDRVALPAPPAITVVERGATAAADAAARKAAKAERKAARAAKRAARAGGGVEDAAKQRRRERKAAKRVEAEV